MTGTRYDRIGVGYANTRREDPRTARRIIDALGDARTVVNVGAGSGSYEPTDRHVIAIEPSDTMASQRPPHRSPAIRATAGALPLRNDSVDAAMAVLTVHHWDDEQARGVHEMRRIARGPVVIVTIDPLVSETMWLLADYLPEIAALDRRIFPPIATLERWLGPETVTTVLPVARDTCDWTLLSFWAHPERVLDAAARRATSGFARLPAATVRRAVEAVQGDLDSGRWDEAHGSLRELDELDVGLRLVSHPGRRGQP
ncbi:MAG: methyltransferase domain-containing protein [Myxococcota bacterium]